jgi:hypothetical protein
MMKNPQSGDLSRMTFWPRPGGRAPIERDVFCPQCGYNLRGLTAGNCPECGNKFDEWVTSPGLPWEKRELIGGVDAFVRTIMMVIFHTDQFCAQMWESMTLTPGDAKKFRRICVAIALGTGVVGWIFLAARAARIGFSQVDCVSIVIGLLLWLELASSEVTRFMRRQTMPEARLQRVIKLAEFTAAPLALAPIQIPLAMIALFVRRLNMPISPFALPAYAVIAYAHAAVWLWTCLAFVYGTMDVNLAELAGFGIRLLAGWIIEGLILLIALPAFLRWVVGV